MHIRLSKITWTGVILVAVPVSAVASWATWLQTRSTRPVYVPVSLAPGDITSSNFKINLSGQYTLDVEAKKTIPFDRLNCLLGVSTLAEPKCDTVSAIKANWTLADNGSVTQRGTSDNDDVGTWSNDTIERELATFRLQRGHSYTVQVHYLVDGGSLAPTDPHLKVEIHPYFYEDTMWTSYFLVTWCKRVAIVGCVVLLLCGLTWGWDKRKLRKGKAV